MGQAQPWDRQAVHDELDRVQADFHRLLLRRRPHLRAPADGGQARYPTRHYDFHRRQLTLTIPA